MRRAAYKRLNAPGYQNAAYYAYRRWRADLTAWAVQGITPYTASPRARRAAVTHRAYTGFCRQCSLHALALKTSEQTTKG